MTHAARSGRVGTRASEVPPASLAPYQPEMGQYMFGQPWQRYEASDLLVAALRAVDDELRRVMWNVHQREYASPFANTGESYSNDVFEAHAYSWDDTVEQPFNFKHGDLEISWYKYLGRGTSTNRPVRPDECAELLRACLESLRAVDVDL